MRQGNVFLVYVHGEWEVVPKDPTTDLSGFDLTEVFCLGCSWHGAPREMPVILMGGKSSYKSSWVIL